MILGVGRLSDLDDLPPTAAPRAVLWTEGLFHRVATMEEALALAEVDRRARALALATLLGAAANVFELNPVKALVWAAVLNGIVAVPVMALLMLVSTSTAVMGTFRVSGRWTVIGWIATAMMGAASTVFVLAMVQPSH